MAVLAVDGGLFARASTTTLDRRDGGDCVAGLVLGCDGLVRGDCGDVLALAALLLDERDKPCGHAGLAFAREQLREGVRFNGNAGVQDWERTGWFRHGASASTGRASTRAKSARIVAKENRHDVAKYS